MQLACHFAHPITVMTVIIFKYLNKNVLRQSSNMIYTIYTKTE